MSLPDTPFLDVPSLLTAAGVVVSLLSAVYSWRSASEARRQANVAEANLNEVRAQSSLARAALTEAKTQNVIATHQHRLETYKAFLRFRGYVTRSGAQFKREATWELWEHVQLAEFYYSQKVATTLTSIVDLSIAIQSSREEWSEDSGVLPADRPALVQKTHQQLAHLRAALLAVEADMRNELRLGASAV